MDGQLLELKKILKYIKKRFGLQTFISHLYNTAMERTATYIGLACLQRIPNQRKKATRGTAQLEYNNVWQEYSANYQVWKL